MRLDRIPFKVDELRCVSDERQDLLDSIIEERKRRQEVQQRVLDRLAILRSESVNRISLEADDALYRKISHRRRWDDNFVTPPIREDRQPIRRWVDPGMAWNDCVAGSEAQIQELLPHLHDALADCSRSRNAPRKNTNILRGLAKPKVAIGIANGSSDDIERLGDEVDEFEVPKNRDDGSQVGLSDVRRWGRRFGGSGFRFFGDFGSERDDECGCGFDRGREVPEMEIVRFEVGTVQTDSVDRCRAGRYDSDILFDEFAIQTA